MRTGSVPRYQHPIPITALVLVLWFAAVAGPAAGAGAATYGVIGGIGLTHLTVYEQRPAPDGANSGSPHVHGLTDEAYYVLSGTGRAELHDADHGFREIDLKPGQLLQFPPRVMHRIVSTGGLVILALMGNAGLAEQGDARIYFGPDVDRDPAAYVRLWSLAKEKGLEGALERRDAAVKAYMELIKLWESDRTAYFAELRRFVGAHLDAIAKHKEQFVGAVETGPERWGRLSRERLESLPQAEGDLTSWLIDANAIPVAYGMCGVLRPMLSPKPL